MHVNFRTHVYLGEYDIRNPGPDCINTGYGISCTDGALKIRIDRYIAHPGYHSNRTSNLNDIGLIRLPMIVSYTGIFLIFFFRFIII